MIKVNYIVSHPIYYQTNLLNYINSYKEIDLNVYFYKKFDIDNLNFDSEFKKEVKFTKKNKIRYHYAFLNNPKNLLKIFAEIFNYKQKSVFWFHGWNHYSIILLSVIIKIFSKKKIFIRAENIYKDNLFSRNLKFFLFKLFDYFLFIGNANYKYYKKYNINKNQLIPLRYSSGITNKELLKNKFIKKNYQKNKIIFVGKLIDRKNIIFLVNSIMKYNRKHNNKFYLDIFGDGILKNKINSLVYKNNFIKLKGFKPSYLLKKIYYKKYNFIILASNHENWGLVINEAMESKLALLLGESVGCKSDLLKNSINGFNFNNNYISLERIFLKISKLNKYKIIKFGEESYKIIENFTIENSSKDFIRLLINLSRVNS